MNERDNSGILFKNREKKTDKHPDYSGPAMIDGKPYQMAAWIKEGKGGKFMSLAFSEPRSPKDRIEDIEYEIPF